jgi:hypothetical protein
VYHPTLEGPGKTAAFTADYALTTEQALATNKISQRSLGKLRTQLNAADAKVVNPNKHAKPTSAGRQRRAVHMFLRRKKLGEQGCIT